MYLRTYVDSALRWTHTFISSCWVFPDHGRQLLNKTIFATHVTLFQGWQCGSKEHIYVIYMAERLQHTYVGAALDERTACIRIFQTLVPSYKAQVFI